MHKSKPNSNQTPDVAQGGEETWGTSEFMAHEHNVLTSAKLGLHFFWKSEVIYYILSLESTCHIFSLLFFNSIFLTLLLLLVVLS